MADGIEELEALLDGLLSKLDDGQRRAIARKIAKDIRRSQSDRIGAQQSPDGAAYAPRKSREPARGRRGAIKRQAKRGPMFRKLRGSAWLQGRGSADEASIGFAGATASRIARVSQLGLRDRVSRDGPMADYPQRVLLGLTEAERAQVLALVLEHVQP